MSSHADTIRRYITKTHSRWPTVQDGREAFAALDALVAERDRLDNDLHVASGILAQNEAVIDTNAAFLDSVREVHRAEQRRAADRLRECVESKERLGLVRLQSQSRGGRIV